MKDLGLAYEGVKARKQRKTNPRSEYKYAFGEKDLRFNPFSLFLGVLLLPVFFAVVWIGVDAAGVGERRVLEERKSQQACEEAGGFATYCRTPGWEGR